MKNWKYLLAILALVLASCTEDIQPRTEDDNEPIPIGNPPRP
ncbi:MAG TPA: hypothetical protein VFW11_24735 [Cyclobacteriaceae bacterium]|nr:hypothetical protein [Cyclobacteriaceae bacterium]HEX5172415.1 hypothetical protein [Cyclobacteriaceae bacterium]